MAEVPSLCRRQAVIIDPLGLHMRCAARFVALAQSFRSDIQVAANGRTANGKSLLDLAILAAECGTTVEIEARGPDAKEAAPALADLIAAGLEADARGDEPGAGTGPG